MLLIVGHGPSVLCGLGHLIDQQTVVRLKNGLEKNQPPEHFGTRTDIICGRSHLYKQEGIEFWQFSDNSHWVDYYKKKFNPKYWKPSHGLSAVFCAAERGYKEVALIGFDRVLNPDDGQSYKWHTLNKPPFPWSHCQRSEHECIHSLGIKIVDFAKEYGTTI